MNGSFYEQLGGVAGLFDQWGACERTVVACALARRVPWPGLRLLQRAVEAALRHHVADERLEREANDELFLAGLLAPADDDDDGEKRLQKLVSLLPLLRTDNTAAKDAWVRGAGALAQRCVDAPRPSRSELCRQLLSYLLVHPALTPQDQRTLTQWLRYLESPASAGRPAEGAWRLRLEPAPDANIWSSAAPFRRTIGKNAFRVGEAEPFAAEPPPESFSANGRDVDIGGDGDRLAFDAAVAQPKSQRSNSLTPPSTHFGQMSSSAENLSDEPLVQKPRSFSLSSERSLAALRPMAAASAGSETRLDDLRARHYAHPATSTVAHWLKSLRLHKYVWLFANISYEQMMAIDDKYLEKLGVTMGARHKILLSIRKLAERGAALEQAEAELAAAPGAALERLRGVLLGPMPAASELPARVVRLLRLAAPHAERAAAPAGEPSPLAVHCWLVERALHHEAFRAGSLRAQLAALRHRLPPRQYFQQAGAPARRPRPRAWPAPPPRGKSHSYPPFPPFPPAAPPPLDYSSLDALCLQMTEQAIN